MDTGLQTEKIEKIIDAITKVAAGDFSVQLEVTQSFDYFDALAVGINMMIDDLRKKYLVELENEKMHLYNEQLRKEKEKAEEKERLVSAFVANISHEIRTPMNGIIGFADLLNDPGLTGEEQEKYIEIIKSSGIRMLNIVNDIINISKLEAKLLSTTITDVSVNDQIEFINIFFRNEARLKGLTLSVNNSLPSDKATSRTDNDKFHAIFINLVKNAIKYTKQGNIEIGYYSGADENQPVLKFYVKDTGIGIPENLLHAIFDRFIQAELINRNEIEGAGLGLSICKGYVEMLGGKIWVESEEGKGSTFWFTIPYVPVTEKNVAVGTKKVTSKEIQNNDLTILIVEDDKTSCELLSFIIKKITCNVLIARTGLDAIEICRNNPAIDIVLMDIRLPVMDGYEATRQIRKFNKNIIIIAQTAYGMVGDIAKSLEAGCNDHISKPINRDVLYRMLQEYSKQKK